MLVMRQGLSVGRGLFLKELFDFGDVFGDVLVPGSRLVGSDLSTWHRLKPTVPYTVVLRIRNSQSEVL